MSLGSEFEKVEARETPTTTPRQGRSAKELLHEFAQYTTAHGLNKIVESTGWARKLIWVAFCLSCFTVCLTEIMQLYKQYVDKPVSTVISVKEELSLKLPAITVCNLNMIRKSQLPSNLQARFEAVQASHQEGDIHEVKDRLEQKFDEKDKWASSGSRGECSATSVTCDEEAYYGQIQPEERIQMSLLHLLSHSNSNTIYNMGHSFDNFIYKCRFKGYSCKNFTKFWTTSLNFRYGNCFTFNSGFDNDGQEMFVHEAHRTGPTYGLKLTLNIEQSEYVPELSQVAGAKIVIQPQREMPFPDDEGIIVMPGRSTSIAMRKQIIKRTFREDSDNRNCRVGKSLNDGNLIYSSKVCQRTCLATKQYQECHCAEIQFSLSNMTVCNSATNKSQEHCLQEVRDKFKMGKFNCECPEPCRHEFFKLSLSSGKWPSKNFEKMILTEMEKKNVRLTNHSIGDNMLEVKIYYESLGYQHIEEQFSVTIDNLVSNIGGQLGLWIGVSVLTVCEFMELASMLIDSCLRKMKGRMKGTHVAAN